MAGKAVNILKDHQGFELGIEKIYVTSVKLAGMLHDVGHGPLSQTFEREILPRVLQGTKWSHEEISLRMIDYIVEHNIEIGSEILKKAKDYESDEKFSIQDDRVSHLLPVCYQDMIVRVYSKKTDLVGTVSEAFEDFQLKTYGIKTQIHATPEK